MPGLSGNGRDRWRSPSWGSVFLTFEGLYHYMLLTEPTWTAAIVLELDVEPTDVDFDADQGAMLVSGLRSGVPSRLIESSTTASPTEAGALLTGTILAPQALRGEAGRVPFDLALETALSEPASVPDDERQAGGLVSPVPAETPTSVCLFTDHTWTVTATSVASERDRRPCRQISSATTTQKPTTPAIRAAGLRPPLVHRGGG